MNYTEKLQGFNATEKYRSELKMLMGLFPEGGKSVLDYGCGIGTAVKQINLNTRHFAVGYDIEEYNPGFAYVKDLTNRRFDVIYFMHSFAHIQYIEVTLRNIQKYLEPDGSLIIITPNREWLDMAKNESYKPDPTVFKHYTQMDLIQLLSSTGYGVHQCGQFGQPMGNQNERLFIIAKTEANGKNRAK